MTDRVLLHAFMSQEDVHYAGGLVAGARILGLFGDASTALLLENDGVEGLLAAYSDAQFLRPVRAGDLVEIEASLVGSGNTSRKLHLEAKVDGEPVCTAEAIAVAKPLAPAPAP